MSKSSIIIAGDCCLRGRSALLSNGELFSLCEDVIPIVQSADASLVNLETAVLRTYGAAIAKSGPIIGTDERVLKLLRELGFTGVSLANNHFADYGADGVIESLQLLADYDFWYVGAGLNAEDAAQTKYLHVGDKRVAIINACEHEFTIAAKDKPGCNALNPIHQFKAIKEAKTKADYVIVIIHGGVEHYQLPTLRMQETYRFFVDAGADAVINHHQHCYSGYEIYQSKPIVYGLGNFFFDWQGQDANWNEGYMVKLTFDKEIGIELIPYIQNTDVVGIKLMKDAEKVQFDINVTSLNEIIANPTDLQASFASWTDLKKEEYLNLIAPSVGKYMQRLIQWHLISNKGIEKLVPEYLTEQRRLLLKSLFQCESHQDVLNTILP